MKLNGPETRHLVNQDSAYRKTTYVVNCSMHSFTNYRITKRRTRTRKRRRKRQQQSEENKTKNNKTKPKTTKPNQNHISVLGRGALHFCSAVHTTGTMREDIYPAMQSSQSH